MEQGVTVIANQPTALSAAFDAFNRHSSRLEASYRDLQAQVAMLTQQLEQEQSARHRELLEKERLGNRLRRTVEALPGAVIVLDGAGIVRERNGQAAGLLNRPLLGMAWADIVRRECDPNVCTDGDLWLHDGRCLSLSRRSLDPEAGEILLLTDVSDTRRLADMVQRADRLSALGEMTAKLAHQIRTPIASALLNVALVRGDTRQNAIAKRIGDRLGEVGRMIDDMLCFAAGERRSAKTFSVTELFADLCETYPEDIEDGGIKVELECPDLEVAGNRDALRGALRNLVENARQACDAKPMVIVSGVRGEQCVFLSVNDNGRGIPADAHKRLFEPFFTTRPQGTGLGLAVVRSVADAHNGDVLVESGEHGSTFTLCLPLAGADA